MVRRLRSRVTWCRIPVIPEGVSNLQELGKPLDLAGIGVLCLGPAREVHLQVGISLIVLPVERLDDGPGVDPLVGPDLLEPHRSPRFPSLGTGWMATITTRRPVASHGVTLRGPSPPTASRPGAAPGTPRPTARTPPPGSRAGIAKDSS